MAQEPTSQSWWQSLPGVITATGGLLTAITALVVALHQAGIFGKSDAADKQEIVAQETPAGKAQEAPQSPPPSNPSEVGSPQPVAQKSAANDTPAVVKPVPQPGGGFDPQAVLRALKAANIGNSVGDAQLLDWLDDDDRTYRRVAEVSIEVVGAKRMNGAAPDIDVIKHHYLELLHLDGGGVLPLGQRVNRPLLRQAILMASNEKNGGSLQRFERALANR
jgi:hypothetical protein